MTSGEASPDELVRFAQFALDNLPDAAYFVEEDSRIRYVNNAACRMLGYSKEELLEKRIYELNPDVPASVWPPIWERLRQERKRTFETRHLTKDGRLIPVEIAANLVDYNGREISIAFARDVTTRKELEARVRHAEKMEAIGHLAGGVAHDFNNQLACILSNAELLKIPTLAPDETSQVIDNILISVKRSTDLTAQLLAFSRRGKYRSEPVDLHVVITEVVEMASRSMDKRIEIVTRLDAARCTTVGDPSQLQNAVLNLALNARDAMPAGGRLMFSTENVNVTEASLSEQPLPLQPGGYVCVSVADTGVGIDDETQRHLFEPFFTTKEAGRGTGLGLAAVYGTVKSHRGCIQVRSLIGEGTVFRLFLPVGSEARSAPPPRKAVPVLKGPIRILLVDDEALVREATQRLLEVLGCEVTVCADGERAVEYYRAFHTSVDLAIVDMVMPVKDGGETFLAMREIDPKGKVLLASGYSRDGAAQAVLERGANGFISKPYTQAQIWEKVVEILATESD